MTKERRIREKLISVLIIFMVNAHKYAKKIEIISILRIVLHQKQPELPNSEINKFKYYLELKLSVEESIFVQLL